MLKLNRTHTLYFTFGVMLGFFTADFYKYQDNVASANKEIIQYYNIEVNSTEKLEDIIKLDNWEIISKHEEKFDKIEKKKILVKAQYEEMVREFDIKINISDTTSPKIELTTDKIHSKNKHNFYKVTDNFDATKDLEVIVSDLNIRNLGKQNIKLYSKDKSNNEITMTKEITVVDIEKPSIQGEKEIILLDGEVFNVKDHVILKDNYTKENNLWKNLKIEGSVLDNDGAYTLKYSLKDNSGNESKFSQKIVRKTIYNMEREEIYDTIMTPQINNTNSISNKEKFNHNSKTKTTTKKDKSNISDIIQNNPTIYPKNTLIIGGVTIPYVSSIGSASAPAYGAGIWFGSALNSDPLGSYFIGHNPGDFYPVMSMGIGSTVTMTDSSGNTRTYTAYDILEVDDRGYNRAGKDVWEYVIDTTNGITLQACYNDDWNKIVKLR